MGLTRYGYYPCGAGASLDRIFGFDIGIKQLAEVTPERLVEQLRRLCGRCGHFRDFDVRYHFDRTGDPDALVGWTTSQQTSVTWQRAYAAYRTNPPVLTLY
jgi:hypothetical protein